MREENGVKKYCTNQAGDMLIAQICNGNIEEISVDNQGNWISPTKTQYDELQGGGMNNEQIIQALGLTKSCRYAVSGRRWNQGTAIVRSRSRNDDSNFRSWGMREDESQIHKDGNGERAGLVSRVYLG